MFVPFVTTWLNSRNEDSTQQKPRRGTARRLERRRGGGGKGGGSSSGGSTGGGGSRSVPISNSGGRGSASAYGGGGGKVSSIPAGSAFAGRSIGGGTRGQVYGSRTYGSGYPGYGGYGVAGRGFPFFFWPVAFGGVGGYGYYHNREYGDANNSSRPGGPMTTITFQSTNPQDPNASTFHVLADNSTASSLLISIYESCSGFFTVNPPTTSNTSLPAPVNDSDSRSPQPEQVVQFYRASSVALSLDGYNNTAALSDAVTSGNAGPGNVTDTPLPERHDAGLLNCLNTTIGDAVPLIDSDSGSARWGPNGSLGSLGLLWVVWYLVREAL